MIKHNIRRKMKMFKSHSPEKCKRGTLWVFSTVAKFQEIEAGTLTRHKKILKKVSVPKKPKRGFFVT